MITIPITYTAQTPHMHGEQNIVSGQRETLRVQFDFSEDWDAYPVRTAVFSSRAATRKAEIDADGYASVHADVIRNGVRYITVSAFGNCERDDGEIPRYNGRPLTLRVDIGGAVPSENDGDNPAYEKLLIRVIAVEESLGEAVEHANAAADAANTAAGKAETSSESASAQAEAARQAAANADSAASAASTAASSAESAAGNARLAAQSAYAAAQAANTAAERANTAAERADASAQAANKATGDAKTAADAATTAAQRANTAAAEAEAAKVGIVQYNAPQTLTEDQQGQARENIGAASGSEVNQLSEEIGEKLNSYYTEEAALPFVGDGEVKVTLEEPGTVYNGNDNLIDICDITDGTYEAGGLTFAVEKNRVTINGTNTYAAYLVLSDTTMAASPSTPAGVYQRVFEFPITDEMYIVSRIIGGTGSAGISFNIRSKTSGNIVSLAVGLRESEVFTPSEDCAAIYFYVPKGTYENCVIEYGLSLKPIYSIQSPNTEILKTDGTINLVSKGNVCATRSGVSEKIYRFTSKEIYGMLYSHKTPISKMFIEKNMDTVNIYVLTTDNRKYMRYRLEKIDNPDINAYGWRIGKLSLYSVDREFITDITTGGEWDMAVAIYGAPDFIGMLQHGSEYMDDFHLYIDGKNIGENDMVTQECNTIQLIHGSKMFNPSDETTYVGYHRKIITINAANRTLTLENHIEWASDLTTNKSYLAMLPIQRTDAEHGQITDTYIDNRDYVLTDCTTSVFVPGNESHGVGEEKNSVSEYKFWGENLGLYGHVKVLRVDPVIPERISFISTSEHYNKVYFDYCGDNHTVTSGDVWRMVTEYMIDITG